MMKLDIQKFAPDSDTIYKKMDMGNGTPIQVESAVRDGRGYTIEDHYLMQVKVNGTALSFDTSGLYNSVDITSVPASILTGAIPSAVTATTQSTSDNSTKIATTAFVTAKPTILSGTTDPASSLGKNGDIYIKVAS